MNLYHYFEKDTGPFLTLSDLPEEEATKRQNRLKTANNVYSRRDHDGNYLHFRRIVEQRVRAAFLEKSGKPDRQTPVYGMLGESHLGNHPSYAEWYRCPEYIEIPVEDWMQCAVSFTYGDSFIVNHPEHHDQLSYAGRVFTYAEILSMVERQGWPQASINEDSPFWMPRYIEAQIWSDELLRRYR